MKTYIAFLRGINVGGHHKVPMSKLKEELHRLDFKNCNTILNSGNIIFDCNIENLPQLEHNIERHLETVFGFPIPTVIRNASEITELVLRAPFKNMQITQDTRLYITFQQKEVPIKLELPWISEDKAYTILEQNNNTVFSVLDVSVSKTPKAMKTLETNLGKNITTRNWKTLLRVVKTLTP